MGVVSRRWVWVESTSVHVASGCGCKEVYRLLIPFLQQHPYFFIQQALLAVWRHVPQEIFGI